MNLELQNIPKLERSVKSTWMELLIPNEMCLMSSKTGGEVVCMLYVQLEMSAQAEQASKVQQV